MITTTDFQRPTTKIVMLSISIVTLIACKILFNSYNTIPFVVSIIQETIFFIGIGSIWVIFWSIVDRINHHSWRFFYYTNLYLISLICLNIGSLINLWLAGNHLLPELQSFTSSFILTTIVSTAVYFATKMASPIAMRLNLAIVLTIAALLLMQQIVLPRLAQKDFYSVPRISKVYIPSWLIITPPITKARFLKKLEVFDFH